MSSSLPGTVVIVTGASSGIGEATAVRLAEHGATVALLARRKDRLDKVVVEIEAAGGTALAVEADISDGSQAERAAQSVVDQFGRLDILINNAGLMLLGTVPGPGRRRMGTDDRGEPKGLLYMTNAALPHLLTAAQDGLREVADSSTSPRSPAGRHGRNSRCTA